MSYNVIMSTDFSTVVSAYEPETRHSDGFQTEAALEAELIRMLEAQGYEYITIHDSEGLVINLRKQLERLNDYCFTEKEWELFFHQNIAKVSEGQLEKTTKIQEDFIQVLVCDDGLTRNIKLIDKVNIHKNSLQVINQYEEATGTYKNRYDVTLLVNGLPLVHVELKRRGVVLKEAFNQINRYQRESFWAGMGLFEYVQLFVISNGTTTKYYSNTIRQKHVSEMKQHQGKKAAHNFEFTSYWADAQNRLILDLVDFTKTFFTKHTLLNILTKYCVFTTEKDLLVMRPYQIVATERLMDRILLATQYKTEGTREAGGYIWHTTGSGKTLTSFKAAQLASKLPDVDKVLFVVDRKDLDYQTIKEYDRFEKGAANGNSSTQVLKKQLENDDARILITTIQKLDRFIRLHPQHDLFTKKIVFIFDECHRSQFGQMHTSIIKHFKRYCMFGFTGTPIFTANATSGKNPNLKTTEQAFGRQLHSYTIVDAINDRNVLPFRIDYVNSVQASDTIVDTKVSAIDSKAILESEDRVREIVSYILEHFDQKTMRNKRLQASTKREQGFNSMFAVSSIPMCKKYYVEFKKQIAEKNKDLKIATIFSFAANESLDEYGLFDDENFDTTLLDGSSREFLESAIQDYNTMFQKNFDTSSQGFENYYKDLSQSIKERKVDLVLVVNMFLTGFDATTLNTLWIDKNVKMHGLIQAFSRTNRILNSVKTHGNIVCFRNLEQEIHEAIALFGNKEANGTILLRTFDEYYLGYADDKGNIHPGYADLVHELTTEFPKHRPFLGEEEEKAFIALFGKILRLRNILGSFDEFQEDRTLSELDMQDYTGRYHDLHEDYRKQAQDKVNVLDDVVFEMELVKQTEVTIDYILSLVARYHEKSCKDIEIRASIDTAIQSSQQLRSKRELIEQFIERMSTGSSTVDDWHVFVETEKKKDIQLLIEKENLRSNEAQYYFEKLFHEQVLKTTGTEIDKILPPMSRFDGGNRFVKKSQVTERIQKLFYKYFGLR